MIGIAPSLILRVNSSAIPGFALPWRIEAYTEASLYEVPQLCAELPQQLLRLLQIARVEPLRKPPVNRSQQFARLPEELSKKDNRTMSTWIELALRRAIEEAKRKK